MRGLGFRDSGKLHVKTSIKVLSHKRDDRLVQYKNRQEKLYIALDSIDIEKKKNEKSRLRGCCEF